MKTTLPRRYAEKACRQLNVGSLRSMSTTISISSNSEGPRLWSGSLSFATPEADFASASKKKHLSTKTSGPAWSSIMSFASPESDFVSASKSVHLREHSTDVKQAAWSGSLSFASPESDLVSASKKVHNSTISPNREWSRSFSFASPESDFVSAPQKVHNSRTSPDTEWSRSLSHASPESDFVSATEKDHNSSSASDDEWSQSLSFASPESDFVSAPEKVHTSTSSTNDQWSQSLSFASPESDFVSAPQHVHESSSADRSTHFEAAMQEIFESQHLYSSPETATGFISYANMIDQEILETLVKKHSLRETIPQSVEDALKDERPIVITTAESPFRVVDVNGAWEGLCGYSREEAIGCNIGSLLQGPDTNMEKANEMVRSLQENGFSDTVLTNYAKNGRSFENHLQTGMIPWDGDNTSSSDVYFVGVLNDISESSNERVAAM